jgi:hypothetical protein
MECLNCECEKTGVLNTIKYAGTIYRERKCPACGAKFWTEELEVTDISIIRDAVAFRMMKYRDRKKNKKYEANKTTVLSWIKVKKLDEHYFLEHSRTELYLEFVGWCAKSGIEHDYIPSKPKFHNAIIEAFNFDEGHTQKSDDKLYFKKKKIGG